MLSSLLFRWADEIRHRARLRQGGGDQALGPRGEDVAHRYLQRLGYEVVARNYLNAARTGELDLVAWDGDVLVFVEVKTRQTGEFGAPERNISEEKQVRIRRAAQEYARRAGQALSDCRFDVLAVVMEPFEVRHWPGAFHPLRRETALRPDTAARAQGA
jgi:putative endonuclease